jgi:hypothetical protein
LEGVLSKALELYKLKHPKNASFLFLHYWLLLKEVPRWSNSMEANKTPPPHLSAKPPPRFDIRWSGRTARFWSSGTR